MGETTCKRRPSTIFATDAATGSLFIKLEASGITGLFALMDELPVVYFGKDTAAYIQIETALEWFEKELACDPSNKTYRDGVRAYRRILEKVQAGEVESN
jgi:hypothetical protein